MISHTVRLYQPMAFTIGMIIVSLFAGDVLFLERSLFTFVNVLMVVGFVICCVVAFVLPLWPFTRLMREAKDHALTDISDKFQRLWESEMGKIRQEDFAKIDYRAIRNLRTLYGIANQMPVWPYDLKTVRSFVAYIIVPFLGIIASAIVQKLIG